MSGTTQIRPRGRVQFVLFSLLVLVSGLLASTASAAPSAYCPTINVNVGFGSSAGIDVSACDGPGDPGMTFGAVSALYGSVNLSGNVGGVQSATYSHFGGSTSTASDTFTLLDGNGDDVTVNITILAPTIVVNPGTVPSATVGVAYSQTYTGSGAAAPYTYAISAGVLPLGLSLNTSTGTLAGTPTAAGSFNFTVRASTLGGFSGTRTYSLVVAQPIMVIAPTTVPSGTVGASYSQTLSTSGGVGPYGYAVTAGLLPAGLAMDSAGTITGTPTAGGSYNFTVTATGSTTGSGAPHTGLRAYTLTINAPTITLPATTLANGSQGVAYSAVLNAPSEGTAPYTYVVTAGALPPGLALNTNSGALSGTPTSVGNFNFAVTATDSSTGTGPYTSAPRGYSLQVDNNPPPVANAVSATVAHNSGTNPITLNITGGVPTSVAIGTGATHGTAIASGTSITYQPTPGYAGSDSFTYTATNGAGTSTPATVVVLVMDPTITVTASGPLIAQVGHAYTQTFTWNGGTQPYSGHQVTNLPLGLSVTGTTANSVTVSGTPTQSGPFVLNVSARDSSTGNGPYTVGQLFMLSVSAPTLSMTPGAGNLPMNYGGASSFQFQASGGTAPYSYSLAAGSLPVGVSFSSAGVLSGTPTVPGNYNMTIRATDSSTGAGAPFRLDQNYTLVVAMPVLTISHSALLDGTAGVPMSVTFSSTGGSAPYSYSLTAGAMPIGMSLSSAGVFSGTPRSDGNFSISLRSTDDNGFFATQVFTFAIAPATVTVTPASLPPATRGVPYSQNLSSSGGIAPYTYSLVSGSLPVGVAFSSAGVITGVPISAGTYAFTVRSTDDAGYNTTVNYSIAVDAPAITLTASAPLNGTAGVAQSASITASGGTAPYTYALTAGALPVGMSFSSAGLLSGTPTVAGTFNLTVMATDNHGNTGAALFAFTIAAPSITLTPAALPNGTRGSAYTQVITATGGLAPYSYSLSAGALPPGLALNSTGALSGTPTADGTFNFTVTATDTLGFTASQAYTLVVDQNAPQGVDDEATLLSGASSTIAVTGNDTGTITSIAITTAPTHGTATVNGLNVVYTPAADYAGDDSLAYTATGPGGTSTPATVRLTIHPLPVPVSRTVQAQAGIAIEVDLTEDATGGPFTAATLVSLTPAQAGTASIAQRGQAYVLTFTPAAAFAGVATARFTLANAYATSAEAAIEFQVIARPDPTQDAEVQGLLNAQAQATRRFASGQINNFQRRLESLHGAGAGNGFSNELTFQSSTHCRSGAQDLPPQLCDPRTAEQEAANPRVNDGPDADRRETPFGLWLGGAIRSGSQDSRASRARVDFETDGLSVGGDYRLNDHVAIGAGLGWGRDDSEIGTQGSRSQGDAYTLAGYASFHPGRYFLDALVGYQTLSYDLRRYVTASGSHVSGSRDGSQWFASISTGADLPFDAATFTPYARLDVARATLDAYTEQGDALYALHYADMDVDTSTGNLGLRLDFQRTMSWGVLTPQFRVEYQYDFQGHGSATMSYADMLSGPFYRTGLPTYDRSRLMLGLGLGFQGDGGFSTRIEYNGLLQGEQGSDHGFMLNLEKRY